MDNPIIFAIAIACITPAGIIVFLRFFLWKDRERYFSSFLYKLDRMNQEDFNAAIKEKLQTSGFSVSTPRAKDTSATFLASDTRGPMRGQPIAIVIRKGRGSCGVQDVKSAKDAQKKHKARFVILITNMFLTTEAAEEALSTGVTVWDRKKLDRKFGGKNRFLAERITALFTEVTRVG